MRLWYHTWRIKVRYRNAIHIFNSLFDEVSINTDFSEKLKIPLKKEPQSVHWSVVETIVHSIFRKDGNKEYHCYISDNLIQDHAFNNLVLDEMLQDINYDQKGIKNLVGVFLERKSDCGKLYAIPKKPGSAFVFRKRLVFPSMQLELKKGHFELTNEELLLIN